MNKPTKEELILLHEMMCKASRHFDEVIKKEKKTWRFSICNRIV